MVCPWLNVAHRTMFHVDLCDLWALAGLKTKFMSKATDHRDAQTMPSAVPWWWCDLAVLMS